MRKLITLSIILLLLFLLQVAGQDAGLTTVDIEDFQKTNWFTSVHHENGVPQFAVHNHAENAKFILDAATNSNATFTIYCCNITSGSVVNETCGNGVSCCDKYKEVLGMNDSENCLTVLFGEENEKKEYKRAQRICKQIIQPVGAGYCQRIEKGIQILKGRRKIQQQKPNFKPKFFEVWGPAFNLSLKLNITKSRRVGLKNIFLFKGTESVSNSSQVAAGMWTLQVDRNSPPVLVIQVGRINNAPVIGT